MAEEEELAPQGSDDCATLEDAAEVRQPSAGEIHAEYMAFRQRVVQKAMRAAEYYGWCDTVYDILADIGITPDEMPLTHAVVTIPEMTVTVSLDRHGEVNANALGDVAQREIRDQVKRGAFSYAELRRVNGRAEAAVTRNADDPGGTEARIYG